LRGNEFIHSVLFDVFEVLDQAHVKMSTIALVCVLESLAGKITALEAVGNFAVDEELAVLLQVRALLAPRPAPRAVRHPDSLASNIGQPGKIAAAEGAVHTTGGD
jgi:hypothetical protein